MKNRKLAIAVLCAGITLLSCCSPSPKQNPTDVSSSHSEVSRTATPQLVHPRILTLSSARTTSGPTSIPTSTPEPPYYTPTVSPATLVAIATLEALITQEPDLGEYYSRERAYSCCDMVGFGLSPNGKWAVFFDHTASGGGGFKIASVDGAKVWSFYYADFSHDLNCEGGCGDAHVDIEQWSSDGRYVYLAGDQMADGGYGIWTEDSHLARLDLASGMWVDTQMGIAHSFSPNGRYLAYRGGNEVHIYELSTESEQVFTLSSEYLHFGGFVWSPDNRRIIYIAARDDFYDGEFEKGFTILMINLDQNSMQVIVENDSRFIYPTVWRETNLVEFESALHGQGYVLDVKTNEFK